MIRKKRSARDERGMVLVVALLLLTVLLLLGATAVFTSTTDLRISANYRNNALAFNIAEAGVEVARNKLTTDIGTNTIDQLLASSAGGDNVLQDSGSIANIYANGNFTASDNAYVGPTDFGVGTSQGTYRVYLTNDSRDGITSIADTNGELTLTSFGLTGNSVAIIQETVVKPTVPPMPGAIVLPGPNVTFNAPNSNATGVAGGSESAVSVATSASQQTVVDEIKKRADNYTCDAGSGSACVRDEPDQFHLSSYDLTNVGDIERLAAVFRSVANTVITVPSGGNAALTAAQVGTTSDRKIVFVDGNATLGPVNGAGVLVVTGTLTLNGNFNYNGLIMCIGQGKLQRNGGGHGYIIGSIFVAQTRDPSNVPYTTDHGLGNPTFDTSGGGSSTIMYDASALRIAGGSSFKRLAWKQL